MEKNRLEILYNGKHSYDIVLKDDFSDIVSELKNIITDKRKICIVTDDNAEGLYAKELKQVLNTYYNNVFIYVMPAGEANKNLDIVRKLYEYLIVNHFDRNDILAALGGGVVGDLTGFAAATYLRGIKFIQIPTTILAMSDSSIGGKTGVDFDAYKNMVGAFHMPSLVYMNISTLNTLDERQFSAGFGEVLKHGLIKDKEYYLWLIKEQEQIFSKQYEYMFKMIYRNCEIKREVVQNDPTEKGERALLNFGHTIGHAVEKLMNFKFIHGECVSVGMIAAGYISMKRGYITKEELEMMENNAKLFKLPIRITGLNPDIIAETTLSDKKKDANVIKFILLKSIGNAVIDTTVSLEEIKEAAEYILSK